MINLWYDSDEVADFHPVVEDALNNVISRLGYETEVELVHHPSIPNSTIVPDFAIKLRSTDRYIFVIEVKKTKRDVSSQRFQNQTRSYVSDFATFWEPSYPKYFCLTNIEEVMLFADRSGAISNCVLKEFPESHTDFSPETHDATVTVTEFEQTFENILQRIFARSTPQWANNWGPIIDSFYQNFSNLSQSLTYNQELSNELTLYELFRLLAFAYLKDYYNLTGSSNQSFFRAFPSEDDSLDNFRSRLENNYNRVLQLDFDQVFSSHPNLQERIFPENLTDSILAYFKDCIRVLSDYSSQAVSDNHHPEYIFNLLTSKVYDKGTLHKEGKIMSDTELSSLLATLTIEDEDSKIIDPCSGDGALLDAAYDNIKVQSLTNRSGKSHNDILSQISGVEIDPFLAQLSTFRLVSKNLNEINNGTEAKISVGDIFQKPDDSEYDALLMNPPFLRNDNQRAPITDADKDKMINAIDAYCSDNFINGSSQPNLYFYFVNYIWHYLNDNGRAGLILMAKFLNSLDGINLKSFISDKVEAVILYPRNYFEDFKVTTVIVLLSKQPSNSIKFLRIIEENLLAEPTRIKNILASNTSITSSDYTLRIEGRDLDPESNWKLFLIDPEDKFTQFDELDFLNNLSHHFSTIKRGGAGNVGGSKIIYPDFDKEPFQGMSSNYRGYGVKNSKAKRDYILTNSDLMDEEAIHFPDRYDDDSDIGLNSDNHNDRILNSLFSDENDKNAIKWRRIVNSSYRSKVQFDILIPRAERTKHTVYFNPHDDEVLLSTNFFFLSGIKNINPNISEAEQCKFVVAFLNSCFGQIQFEIHSNNQEGLRKLEGFHIEKFQLPDLSLMTQDEVTAVIESFEDLNSDETSYSGAEGLATGRRNLDESIGELIFSRDTLGFQSADELVNYFELFLADLVEDRRL